MEPDGAAQHLNNLILGSQVLVNLLVSRYPPDTIPYDLVGSTKVPRHARARWRAGRDCGPIDILYVHDQQCLDKGAVRLCFPFRCKEALPSEAIVGLFLDGELSWERARQSLRHEAPGLVQRWSKIANN